MSIAGAEHPRYGLGMDPRLGEMTLFELEILSLLSQHKSLRSLARSKRLLPSHLSKVLRRIEHRLESSVLNRSSKGFVLTVEGRRLSEVARNLLGGTDALLSRAKPVQRERLTIGGVRFICSDVIAPLISILGQQLSQFDFRILDMAPDQLLSAAFQGVMEVMVTVDKPPLSRAWHLTRLTPIFWKLYANADHKLGAVACESAVLEYPFLVPVYWTGEGFERGTDHCPVPWQRRLRGCEVSSTSTAFHVLRHAKDSLVFAPELAARSFLDRQEIREIQVADWKAVSLPLYLAVREETVKRSVQESIRGLLLQFLSAGGAHKSKIQKANEPGRSRGRVDLPQTPL